MKKKDFKDLKDSSLDQVTKLIGEKNQELARVRSEIFIGKHKNVKIAKNIRRDRARLETMLQEKKVKEVAKGNLS
ncbi:50S ribosomal protein L29 [Candidatus Woesebacteria bacterium]|nr:50S ribosomal protein L29 [Candidatus Woesebacteria bacterium]